MVSMKNCDLWISKHVYPDHNLTSKQEIPDWFAVAQHEVTDFYSPLKEHVQERN